MQKQRRTETTTIHSMPPPLSGRWIRIRPTRIYMSFSGTMVAILRHRLHVHLLLTLPQTLNATNLSTQCCLLTPGLKLYALPYSLMGFVLHATTYYVLGCIAILQGSTTTLRPIKHPSSRAYYASSAAFSRSPSS
ncbi:hypothetical protein HBH96_027710 [Parastagonospora nodorum]|nr:hypothetical protein HBH96_027710 [Parastagonospora nodorum]KAH5477366.1 hypothetical protein HBI28_071830 [Parastagonospora nodorum]KAH5646460.1 hypothetical protein HBI22_029290 [Parastagonospora nodorum]